MNRSTKSASPSFYKRPYHGETPPSRFAARSSPRLGRDRNRPLPEEPSHLLDDTLTEAEGLARNPSLMSIYAGSF
ncbi:hypothetical protein I2I05_13880 [Hymenobacter sp. BT683]|uniref:Uncharacterized protein n=1 Tax=Hymenobacter jeongseonensis TaxID=2791027 RepID=A0ABS0IJG9_9BACT|nr:hypothetical protein [Hymenobacter jeongseonensis]MBF9238491.1 hypothetical protein [Hymenobacter jeongseonensis]